MPKLIPFKEISKNKYEFNQFIKIVGYDARLQVPKKLAEKVINKKIKVTIEVLEE